MPRPIERQPVSVYHKVKKGRKIGTDALRVKFQYQDEGTACGLDFDASQCADIQCSKLKICKGKVRVSKNA